MMNLISTQHLSRTAGPAAEPVSLAEARDQCEIAAAVTAHDTKLTRYIAEARERFEDETQHACISQTFTLSMEAFPANGYLDEGSQIRLPKFPVQLITSITYYDTDNASQTLATTVYGLDANRSVVYLKYNQEWPGVTEQYNGVVITFVVGYGASSTYVPASIRQILCMDICHRWHYRDFAEIPPMSPWIAARNNLIAPFLRNSYP